MPSYSLLNLKTLLRAVGRGSIWYDTGAFPGTGNDLDLTHLGDTRGAITPAATYNLSELKVRELYGESPLEASAAGPAVDLTFEIWAADKELVRNIIQPVAGAPGGTFRPRPVTEYTLVVFPEKLFIEDDVQVAVAYTTAGGWTVGGDAASSDQEEMIKNALFFWRGYWTEPAMPVYQYDEGGESLFSATFRAMPNLNMPDGNVVYTAGDPADESIEIAAA